MSSTRHAAAGTPLRQERFSSSSELKRGLMANLVAKRCSVLTDPIDRELIYFIQYLSHERGLGCLSEDLRARYPEQIATKTMQRFGLVGPYSADQVRAVRREIPQEHEASSWENRQARLQLEAQLASRLRGLGEDGPLDHLPAALADTRPGIGLPAARFITICHEAAAAGLSDYLTELCLNPELPVDGGPWYFPNLISRLRAYLAEWEMEWAARIAPTDITRRVGQQLEYSLRTRGLTLTEGIEGIGKTCAAENFARQRPGRARYVQVPGTDDESGFYREIAKALGVSINLNSKARELRERIEDVLQAGDLLIIFDEAHWLWGVNSMRGGLPRRMLWVLTALVNKGVPVAFVATPQFAANQAFTKKHTRWRDGQLDGRIDHRETLPEVLSGEELAAVVRAKLPAADDKAVLAIADFARNSPRCLGTLAAVVKRAKFLAQENGRTEPSRADIKAIILERSSGHRLGEKPSPSADESTTPRQVRPAPVLESDRGFTSPSRIEGVLS